LERGIPLHVWFWAILGKAGRAMMEVDLKPPRVRYAIKPTCGDCRFFHPYSDKSSGMCKTSNNYRQYVRARQLCTLLKNPGVFAFRRRRSGGFCWILARCANCKRLFRLTARNQRFCSHSCQYSFWSLQHYRRERKPLRQMANWRTRNRQDRISLS